MTPEKKIKTNGGTPTRSANDSGPGLAASPLVFLHLIRQLGRLIEKNYDSRNSLTRNQTRIIEVLLEQDGLTQTELAAQLDMHKVSVGIHVGELEGMNLVERRSHPTDGRAKCAYLTPLLHANKHLGADLFSLLHRRAIEGINPIDYETMLMCMAQMRDNLSALTSEHLELPAPTSL